MLRRAASRLAAFPSVALFAVFFATEAIGHLTLLRLPYYWDEGGYYIPAALDFFHRWTLIPEFTNAHPPLPNVVLGLLWHIVGCHIIATRLCAAAFASAALVAVFRLGQRMLDDAAALALTVLTAVYPIWYTQSTLAHADIFAAAFTMWGFVLYFRAGDPRLAHKPADYAWLAVIFSLAALSKETAILEPATLAGLEVVLLVAPQRPAAGTARTPVRRGASWQRLVALCAPVLPLIAWYAYHRARTGFTFGNPEYLRYNATANLSAAHVITALRYRFLHLAWQRNIWLPLVFAAACLLLPKRPQIRRALPMSVLSTLLVLLLANWIAFSVLGGALLTRYLLPMYPLILLIALAIWRERNPFWPAFAAITTAAFVWGWWFNPPIAFAPEDNLTYRDMIVVHRDAVRFLDTMYPNATVMTAWPLAAELFRTDLGYTDHPMRVRSVNDFSAGELLKAAQDPGSYDTAVIFPTHYVSPALEQYLRHHPGSLRSEEFDSSRDLTGAEAAALLHGHIVWSEDRNGESATIIRFARSYDASIAHELSQASRLR